MKTGAILSIETALDGGSIAVSRSGEILYEMAGRLSRASELVDAIKLAMESANLSTKDLHMIAVSTGPGSFTGIRVGIATALGVTRALGIAVSGISLFDAIAFSIEVDEAAIAIPLGRGRFGIQSFRRDESVLQAVIDPTSMTESALWDLIIETPNSQFLIHGNKALFTEREPASRIPPNVTFINANLASLIANRAAQLDCPGSLAPIYLGR